MGRIYSGTGVGSTGDDLRITKSSGALRIACTKELADLSTETIDIFVERSEGNNEDIATSIPLLHFIKLLTFGESAVHSDGVIGFVALCELAKDGSIELMENESIRIKLSGLDTSVTYTIDFIEYPEMRSEALEFDKKVINTDETNRELNSIDADLALIEGVSSLKEMRLYYDNDVVTKYTADELRIMQHDIDPLISLGNSGVITPFNYPDHLIVNLVGVLRIDVEKTNAKALNITYLNAFELVDESETLE